MKNSELDVAMASLEHNKISIIWRHFGVISLVGLALSAGQTLAEDSSRGKAPSSAVKRKAPPSAVKRKASSSAVLRKASSFAAQTPAETPWAGLYMGLNVGSAWDRGKIARVVSTPLCCTPGATITAQDSASAATAELLSQGSGGGFIGGGQIGYNWQLANSWVVGAEADFQGIAGGSNSATPSNLARANNDNQIETDFYVTRELDYFGTIRGRFGWLPTSDLLLYGTAGLVYGGIHSTASFAQFNDSPETSGWTAGGVSRTRVGWTAGGGVEWMFMPNVSAKVEYLYYDLGTVTYSAGILPGFLNDGSLSYAIAPIVQTRHNGNMIRVGANYYFGGTKGKADENSLAHVLFPDTARRDDSDEESKENNGKESKENNGKESKEKPWLEIESGTDVTSRGTWYQYIVGLSAINGTLEESGVRSRTELGYGRYNYPIRGQDADIPGTDVGLPWVQEFKKIYGREMAASFLVGYQFVSERWELLGMIGAEVLNHKLSPTDPSNSVRGSRAGLKLYAQLDAEPTDNSMLYGYASYSTAFQTAEFDLKLGKKVLPQIRVGDLLISNIYVGPHGYFFGDMFERRWKAGAHVTATEFGPYHATLAVGYVHDRYLGPGAYTSLEISRRF